MLGKRIHADPNADTVARDKDELDFLYGVLRHPYDEACKDWNTILDLSGHRKP